MKAKCEFCNKEFEYEHADLFFMPKSLEQIKKWGDSFPPLKEMRKVGKTQCPFCNMWSIVFMEKVEND